MQSFNKVELKEDNTYPMADIWDQADSTIYKVLDDDGVNMGNAQVRHFDSDFWLYVDDASGFEILTDVVVAGLDLEEIKEG